MKIKLPFLGSRRKVNVEIKPVQPTAITPYEAQPADYDPRCTEHYEWLTVERAGYYLARAAGNQRTLNVRHAKRIGERRLRGEFAPEIAFLDIQNNVLINGQHTARSVIETGIPVFVKVRVWQSDIDVMPYFDRSIKPRSNTDVYKIEGRNVDKREQAVMNRLFYVLTGSTRQISKEEQAVFLAVFDEPYKALLGHLHDRRFINGTFGCAITLCYHLAPQEVENFASQLTNNVNCNKGTLLYTVREIMTAVGPTGKQKSITGSDSYNILFQLIWAVEKYIADGNCRCRQLKEDRARARALIESFGLVLPTFEGLLQEFQEGVD